MIYKHLPVNCDLCVVAIEECLHHGIAGSGTADLHVHPSQYDDTRTMIDKIKSYTVTKLPIIMVVSDATLRRWEWFIKQGGIAVGSPSI